MLTGYYGCLTTHITFSHALIQYMQVDNDNSKATAQDTGILIQKLVPGLRMNWTTHITEAMSFEEIKKEIDSNHLIIAFRNEHACLIAGYDQVNDKPALWLHDPARADGPGLIYYHTYAQGWVAHTHVTSANISAELLALHGVE
jgi:hypothetical protein